VNSEFLRAVHPEFFAALDDAFSDHPDARLRRLDIGKQGGLQAELTVANRQQWVAWNGAGLKSLAPEQDRKIPLGRVLRRDNAPRDFRRRDGGLRPRRRGVRPLLARSQLTGEDGLEEDIIHLQRALPRACGEIL